MAVNSRLQGLREQKLAEREFGRNLGKLSGKNKRIRLILRSHMVAQGKSDELYGRA